MRLLVLAFAALTAFALGFSGCTTPAPADPLPELPAVDAGLLPFETGACMQGTGGAAPPLDEEVVGLLPVDLIFDGSLRHPDTRVLLVPPAHGDLTSGNSSRDADAYLAATLEGIFAWEPAIDLFAAAYPEYGYLQNVSVAVDPYDAGTDQVGYDIVIDYAETSGPAFRGVATQGPLTPQGTLDDLGVGGTVHHGDRYVLLSLFAYSERAGQTQPDYPETHEVRGVTMHEFAHVWGLGHSSTWTPGCGADLMNSPYPFVYGDGDPAGDGGERTPPLCITSLDLYGLAQLYRWLPNGTYEGSQGAAELPESMVYETYCQVFEEAQARAQAWLRAHGG